MKNKKRVLIILLTLIIIVLIVLGIVLLFGGIRNKAINDFKTEVSEAACNFASEENYTEAICNAYENLCKIRFSTLISADYLSADLINPRSNIQISEDTSSYVQISFSEDKMICTYEEG